MKFSLAWAFATLLAAGLFTGCQSEPANGLPPSAPVKSARDVDVARRNNCYSLLHQLLDDDSNTGVIHYFKQERPDVKHLMNKIAATCRRDARRLEKLARDNPSVRLDDTHLPLGEAVTRAAVAFSRDKALLVDSGDEFDINLLVTQVEALAYALDLAQGARDNESDPDRACILDGISHRLESLHQEASTALSAKRQAVGK